MKKIKQEKLELKNPVVDSILNKSKKESTTLIFENSVITKARNVKNAFVDGLFDKNALIGGACGAAALLIVAGISDASLDQHFNPEKYEGKTVKFKSHVFISDKLPKGLIFTGRHGMVCCADDIAYLGFICETGDKFSQIKSKEWYNITAKIHIEELEIYKGAGPVLTLLDIEKATPPKDEIVYFN